MLISKNNYNSTDYIIWSIDGSDKNKRNNERLAVGEALEFMLPNAKLHHHESGKPYLTGYNKKISISHTKGFAAIALNVTDEIGIDIEYKSDRAYRLSSRFMCKNEINALNSSNNKLEYATLIWCAKECAYKKIGISGIDFKLQYECSIINDKEIKLEFKQNAISQSFIFKYEINSNYILVVG